MEAEVSDIQKVLYYNPSPFATSKVSDTELKFLDVTIYKETNS